MRESQNGEVIHRLSLFYRKGLEFVFIALAGGMFLQACSSSAPFLVPQESGNKEGANAGNGEVKVQIKPIYTSGLESADRDHYQFDFSNYFTAIEVHFRNGTQDPVRWDLYQSVLKDSESKEFRPLNEEEAVHYYRFGDQDEKGIILLEKSYEQQKEEIGKIKEFILKAGIISPNQEVTGLILFKRVSFSHCDKILLVVGGVQIGNRQETSLKFPLSCPED
ncbi:MAG: hypothetical protein HY202_00250 [Nitrospirae bacterium]|nr:hypothetical protein [Nitrospirota bacterium]MBI3604443.1 hypothetical protein [Nitrospirota bacterium]